MSQRPNDHCSSAPNPADAGEPTPGSRPAIGGSLSLRVAGTVNADITISNPDSYAPTNLFYSIFDEPFMRIQLAKASAQLVGNQDFFSLRDHLTEIGVTAVDLSDSPTKTQSLYADAVIQAVDSISRGGLRNVAVLADFTKVLGSGGALGTTVEDIYSGPLALFGGVSVSPSVAIRLPRAEKLTDIHSSTRNAFAKFVSRLSEGFEVTLYGSEHDVETWWLTYRNALDADFDYVISGEEPPLLEEGPHSKSKTTVGAILSEGLSKTQWRVLDHLFEDAAGASTYHSLQHDSRIPATYETLRHVVSKLVDDNLVTTYTDSTLGGGRRALILTETGRAAVRQKNAEIGREMQISDFSQTPGNISDNPRVPRPKDGRGGEGGPQQETPEDDPPAGAASHPSGLIPIRSLDCRDHDVLAAAAPNGGILVANRDTEGTPDHRSHPFVSYDLQDEREVVVSAEWKGAVPGMVAFTRVLTEDPLLSAVEEEMGPEFENLPLSRLRLSRCSQIGWLGKKVRDAETFINRVRQANVRLMDLLSRRASLFREGDNEAARNLGSSILSLCQGLVGSMTWVLHHLDIDLIRHFKIPEYMRDFHSSGGENPFRRRESLLRTVTLMMTIGSAKDAYPAQRILFEKRTEKREYLWGTPDVSTNPIGQVIGSLVITGKGVENLVDPDRGPSVADALSSPGPLQTDGEHFCPFRVSSPLVKGGDEDAVRRVVNRMCGRKNLTPDASTAPLMSALATDAIAVGKAFHSLSRESFRRRIRLDEVRRALSSLDVDNLLSRSVPSSARAILSVLLEHEGDGLSQRELAEAADITTRTVRNNAEILTALNVVECMDRGPGLGQSWRCTLPTNEERYSDRDAVPVRIHTEMSDDGRDRDLLTDGEDVPHERLYGADRTLPSSPNIVTIIGNLATALTDRSIAESYRVGDMFDLPAMTREIEGFTEWLDIAMSFSGHVLDPDAFDDPPESHVGASNSVFGTLPKAQQVSLPSTPATGVAD